MNHWFYLFLMCLCENHAFVYIDIHNNGNTFIKSCWFIIWTCITFIWLWFSFNIQIWKRQLSFWLYILFIGNHLIIFWIEAKYHGTFQSMFIIEYKKPQQCCIWKLNPIFKFDLHQSTITNEHQYVTKMH